MEEYKIKACIHVISEPGDCTRYDYIVTNDGPDYMFMGYKSYFKFPQRITIHEAKRITNELDNNSDETLKSIADKYDCNVWTIKECVRCINKMEANNI